MKAYPPVGTRVRLIAGEYAGRQARTCRTRDGGGRIELDLLGGTHELGISECLENVERDPQRKIDKLPPRALCTGDRLYSLIGRVFPLGTFTRIVRVHGIFVDVESEYGRVHTLAPREDFPKRWAHLDGHPILWPPVTA